MNGITLLLCSVLVGFLSYMPSSGPPEGERTTVQVGEPGEQIVGFVKKAEALGFTGAVLAAKDGRVVAAVAVGYADLADTSLNTPSTLFEIASATKQFTAAAVMRLVQDGKLSLDDPIAKHLPGVPENCSAITVRHLLQHTSGIPGSNAQGAGTDLAAVLPGFLGTGPLHTPGTNFEYWNQGYSLLSEIIAHASGKSFTAFCSESLFAPAGMTLTCFTGDQPPAIEDTNVAIGRSSMGRPRSALDHPYGEYGFQYRGMGGVVTNVWDLWRWDRALHDQSEKGLFKAESQAALFKPGLKDYALGWFVRKDKHGKTIQSHSGSVRGFVCEIRRLPDDDGCIFVLANRDNATVRQLADGVQAILLGKPYTRIELPDPLTPEMLQSLVGKFKDARGNVLEVTADGGTARATISWAANKDYTTRAFIGLNAGKAPVLFEWTDTTVLALKKDEQGAVTSVMMRNEPFKRVEKEAPKP